MPIIKFILQVIGLVTVAWFVAMIYEEYMKIRQKEREENGCERH